MGKMTVMEKNKREKEQKGREIRNEMRLCLPALSVNEGVARAAVAAFFAQFSPTAGEIEDVKCALSEAVTNTIVHAYQGKAGLCYIKVYEKEPRRIRIVVKDRGCGIDDVKKAREPLFTTGPEEERSGMGFTVMESFMDSLTVYSQKGKGTVVIMEKSLSASPFEEE